MTNCLLKKVNITHSTVVTVMICLYYGMFIFKINDLTNI